MRSRGCLRGWGLGSSSDGKGRARGGDGSEAAAGALLPRLGGRGAPIPSFPGGLASGGNGGRPSREKRKRPAPAGLSGFGPPASDASLAPLFSRAPLTKPDFLGVRPAAGPGLRRVVGGSSAPARGGREPEGRAAGAARRGFRSPTRSAHVHGTVAACRALRWDMEWPPEWNLE